MEVFLVVAILFFAFVYWVFQGDDFSGKGGRWEEYRKKGYIFGNDDDENLYDEGDV